jgi:hypothetical protein
MFHLKSKPSPPSPVDAVTPGHAVDSSAKVTTPCGASAPCSVSFSVRRNATDSRFSRPPWTFGTHSPSLRE